MKHISRWTLQVGLAITFAAIGVMILQDPVGWGAMILPWAAALIPGSVVSAMVQTAYLDLAVAFFLLFPRTAWVAAFVGAIHILIVLITAGINVITIRDVAILAAAIVLCLETLPLKVAEKLRISGFLR